ncbi:MAG TPA: hypothetical protein VFA70_01335 [Dehalococcoidia bacterium]|nr:hypothetical protein [Dehalococcoidia bacterium]
MLVGMPRIAKRLPRNAQFQSRVRFVHQFRPLSEDELRFLLEQKWQELDINRLNRVTEEVVEAARESLVIGTV